MYVTSSDLLEFQISCYVGGNEDVGELAIGHEELGHKVNVPVIDAAVFLPWFGACRVVAVLLEKLLLVSMVSWCTGNVVRHTDSILTDADSLCSISIP